MPKPVKKAAKPARKRPSSDPIKRVKQLMEEQMAMAEIGVKPWTTEPDVQAIVSEHMRKLGSKGGKVSGAKRMEMPEKNRIAIATKAAVARWAKKSL